MMGTDNLWNVYKLYTHVVYKGMVFQYNFGISFGIIFKKWSAEIKIKVHNLRMCKLQDTLIWSDRI